MANPEKPSKFRIRRGTTFIPSKKLAQMERKFGEFMTIHWNMLEAYKNASLALEKRLFEAEQAQHTELIAQIRNEMSDLYWQANELRGADGGANVIARRDVSWELIVRQKKKEMAHFNRHNVENSLEVMSNTQAAMMGNAYVDPGAWSDQESKDTARENRAGTDAAEKRYNAGLEAIERAKLRSMGKFVE